MNESTVMLESTDADSGADDHRVDEVVDDADEVVDESTEDGPVEPRGATELEAEPSVEVRRNPLVSGVLAAVAAVVAVAYLTRAIGAAGTGLDWCVCLVLVAVAVGYLRSFLDARVPLLVADERGARIRLGRTWCGMTWQQLEEVEHTPRRAWSDGRIVLLPLDEAAAVDALTPAGRRQAGLNRRFHGASFAVPLALSTRVSGTDDLTAALLELVGDATVVVEVDRSMPDHVIDDEHPERADLPEAFEPEETRDGSGVQDTSDLSRPTETGPTIDSAEVPGETAPDAFDEPTAPSRTPSPTPSPLRDVFRAVRSDVSRDRREHDAVTDATVGATALRLDQDDSTTTAGLLPEVGELRRGDPGLEETMAWSGVDSTDVTDLTGATDITDVTVLAHAPDTDPVVDDGDPLTPRPAPDPVVGPVLAAARTRIGLGVDQLADRTRIRPHVIEAIEVDDFGPCGGDFYARGHLRTLARVVGVDAGPLVASYDERYADAPIDPRRVFEAELATAAGGPIRGTRGGPNWSVLVAAAMAVVLVWSIARLLFEGSTGITPVDPGIGPGSGTDSVGQVAAAVPVEVSAPAGGARLIVRDSTGKIVMKGQLAFGESRTLRASPPVRISSTDGSVEVTVAGHSEGAMGETGQTAQKLYTAPD